MYLIQTLLIAFGRGLEKGFQGVMISAFLSIVVFFGMTILHSFEGGRVFYRDIVPIAGFAFLYFGGWAALILGAIGFVYGAVSTINERAI